MATCSATIARAFRMAKIVAVGDEASSTELDEGMAVLNSFYQRLADTALGAKTPIYKTAAYEPLEGERVVCTAAVTLPLLYQDSDGVRLPRDLAAIAYNAAGAGWRFYVSDRGTWVRIDGLVSTNAAPFSDRNEDGLAALVASELVDTFGGELTQSIMMKARRFQSQMQPVDLYDVEYF